MRYTARFLEAEFNDFKEKQYGAYLTHVFNVIDPFAHYGDMANTEIAEFFKAHIK